MDKKTTLRLMAAALTTCAALTACSNDDEPQAGVADGGAKFVFATSTTTSAGTANVLLTGNSLNEGSLTTVGNGLSNEGATQWVFLKNNLVGLTYNQGNAGTTKSYYLGTDGQMQKYGVSYSISRFSSYGTYDNDIITMATGSGPRQFADAEGHTPMTLAVTYLNVIDETTRTNNTASGDYSMENYLGNGEYVTLAGIEQNGKRLVAGLVPMGLSPYGSAYDNGKWIREGYDDLVKKESGGQGGGSYEAGSLSGTQYPDECWVAIYDNEDLLNPTLVKTDKISSPCGRYRSQYYQTVWSAENGDIYVFSSSYAKTMTDSRQKTTLPAGVCRIPAGSKAFDDYYCDIEAQTPGKNRSFMRCWPAGGNYFLMQMYDRSLTEKDPAAVELAIFDAAARKLTYVTGLPENISSIGKTVYTDKGKVYIPINVENENPAIYGITTATAEASRGVSMDVTSINGFGYMTPQ